MAPNSNHPVLSERYILGTKATFELHNIVKHMIKMNHTGNVIIGKSRVGKTTAIDFVEGKLNEDYGGTILTLKHECSTYPTSSYWDGFFTDLLESIDHQFDSSGNYAKKKSRIVNFLISNGLACEGKRIFLFLDEAQNLTAGQYGFFVDISNVLRCNHVKLQVLSVGEKQLEYNRSQFINANKIKIIARFMPRVYTLYGLRSSEDIKLCLNGYDCQSEYPEGSGCSFTQYFFPEAFSAGFRLQNESESLWKVFMEVKKELKISGDEEITMESFTNTIHYVYINFSAFDRIDFCISQNMWKEAIVDSGYCFYGDLVNAESEPVRNGNFTVS